MFCKADHEVVHGLPTPLVPSEERLVGIPTTAGLMLAARRKPQHCQADGKRSFFPCDPVYRFRVGSVELDHQFLDRLDTLHSTSLSVRPV